MNRRTRQIETSETEFGKGSGCHWLCKTKIEGLPFVSVLIKHCVLVHAL